MIGTEAGLFDRQEPSERREAIFLLLVRRR